MDTLNRINKYLPTDLHFTRKDLPLDKKTVNGKMLTYAKKYPDLYAKNIHHIGQLGEELAYEYGHHVGINDLTHNKKKEIRDFLDAEDRKLQGLSDEQKKSRLIDIFNKVKDKTMQIENNHLVDQGKSRGRGNPDTITRTLSSPVYTVDMNSEPFPFMIKNSLSSGYKSHELFATGSQARYAAVQAASSTSEPGAMGKILVANTEHLKICCKDCGSTNGIERSINESITGRYEARTNKLITKEYLSELKKRGKRTLIVRDPTTCQAKSGVCQMCYGVDARGQMPGMNSNIGIVAAQTIAEKSTQLVLSAKHNIGGKVKSAVPQGFEAQKILLNTPDYYRGKATVATTDGKVTGINSLQTGGWNVKIADQDHFVGAEVKPTIKVGDDVNKGDIISSGLASPKDLTHYAGVNQARKYVVDNLYKANGGDIDKRIFGVVAKGYIDLAKHKNDKTNQLFSYDALASEADIPNASSVSVDNPSIVGKFLAQPFLHYSIGTKITRAMIKKMKSHGLTQIKVSHNPVGIEPVYKTYEQKPLANSSIWKKMNYRGIKKGLTSELLYNTGLDVDGIDSDRTKYTLGKL